MAKHYLWAGIILIVASMGTLIVDDTSWSWGAVGSVALGTILIICSFSDREVAQ